MTIKWKSILVGMALSFAFLAAAAAFAGTERTGRIPTLNPVDYPSLTDEEIGHIRRIVKLSRQLPGDWSGMGTDIWGVAERTLQFQLAYMADTIGLVQHNYTPAYRELYQTTMDALIQKMTVPDVWEAWLNSSRGGVVRNRLDDTTAGWIDPIKKHNIMLKGYLLQAGAMYEMLYRDGKYDKLGAFTFRHIPFTWGNGPVTFRYTLSDIADIVHQEYVDSNFEGVQCEPNVIFPQCNQSPILGLINCDQTHGTGYAAEIAPKFKEAWLRNNYTDPVTKQNVAYIVASTGEKVAAPAHALGDSWAGSWMHAWDPDYVESIYPTLRNHYYEDFLTGAYAKHVPDYGNRDLIGLSFGMFAFMAAEVGDKEARQKLLDYADRNFHPVWEDGAYYYPRSYEYTPDAQGNSHGIDSWSGNVLLAMARLDKGSGFLKLYREPWGKDQLNAPVIGGIDFTAVNVSQAYYDADKKALIITLKPGPVRAREVSFVVNRLDPSATYQVLKDGKLVGRLSQGSVRSNDIVRRDDGTATISTDLSTAHTFIIVAEY